ncbi:MAG TPA: hypothetical protein RMH99_10090, partial [Sandaracinaceae bacterium LLY-WYZ-13_1]|nr:hypothetical protein [Sandaracinaceae bacterium LLY-WYZ-13_1]
GVLPLRDGAAIEALDEARIGTDGPLLFALTLDPRCSVARAPELVGAFAARAAEPPFEQRAADAPSEPLAAFVEARSAHLPPRGVRVRSAYVPDAPLPR